MLNALKTLPASTSLPANAGILARGKSLVKFYKSGIVNIWKNHKTSKELRKKCRVSGSVELAKLISTNAHLLGIEAQHGKENKAEDARMPPASRSDLLTLIRTERDIRKLPFFAVVFAVCFECTPLVLWAFPQIAPSTCYSLRYREKLRLRYSAHREELRKCGADLNGSESVFLLSKQQLHQLAKTLGLINSYVPWRLIPVTLLRNRIQQHLTVVRADDYFLKKCGEEINTLDKEELLHSLIARGLPLDGGVAAIQNWLNNFREPMDAGYLFRA